MNANTVAAKLKELRGEKTQAEIADALGIRRSAYNNYEAGLRIPKDVIKKQIADYYGVSVDSIFFA